MDLERVLESTGGRLVIVMAAAGREVLCALRSRYSADLRSQRGVETVAVSCSICPHYGRWRRWMTGRYGR